MGGAVAAVTKPILKPVAKAIGMDKPVERAFGANQSQMDQIAKEESASKNRASASEEQAGARMRGARRRGRMLLSDSRLNPEAGVETLGGGNNLG